MRKSVCVRRDRGVSFTCEGPNEICDAEVSFEPLRPGIFEFDSVIIKCEYPC